MALPVQNITILPPDPRRGGVARPQGGAQGDDFAQAVRRNGGEQQRKRSDVDGDAEDKPGADPRVVRLNEEDDSLTFPTIDAPKGGQLASGYGAFGAATGVVGQGGPAGRGSVLDITA